LPTRARIRSTIRAIAAPPDDVQEVAVVHKVLSDPTRLRILRRLAQRPGTVSDLMRDVDLSQPLVSWHVRRLRAAGLIETRRNGREVICTLSPDALIRFHERERAVLGLGGVS
jgi:DNA-binding transcriptional ArsR family regulator